MMEFINLDDTEVRAVWDDEHSKWWFSVLDIVGVLRCETDYEKNRNYWKYLKAKLKRENNQLGSVTTQFKFTAPDGKKRLANVLDYDGVKELAKNFPSKQANRFIEWFTYSEYHRGWYCQRLAADSRLSVRGLVQLCRANTNTEYCKGWFSLCPCSVFGKHIENNRTNA